MRRCTIGLVLMCVLWACSTRKAPPAAGELPREDCVGVNDGLYCMGREAVRCEAGDVVSADDCLSKGQECTPPHGCLLCAPGSYSCAGNMLLECASDGARYEPREECEAGLSCSAFGCADLCGRAEQERSYIGCDYWPVFTSNRQLDTKFKPAVAVANPNLVAAQVTITRGDEHYDVEVAPGGVASVELAYLEALREPRGTALVRNGAYHLVASVPVTVHQFNPLLFELPEDCARDESGDRPGEPDDSRCHSYTNDASLLLPTHALVRDDSQAVSFVANTRASSMASDAASGPFLSHAPGLVAIVATGDRPVQVRVKSSAFTLGSADYQHPLPDGGVLSPGPDAGAEDAGPDQDAAFHDAALHDAALHDAEVLDADAPVDAGADAEPFPQAPASDASAAIPPLLPGESLPALTLMPGDVLQLLSDAPRECADTPVATRRDFVCPLGAEYDLTGTEIEADGPIAVIAGHDCTYVPLSRTACDHLEESMFPVDTWGAEVVVARPRGGRALPHILRVLSASDDNLVRFSPELHEPVTLARGQSLEIETTEHVVVRAERPISVAQYLVGQDGQDRVGDPSMSVAIPVEQYRSRYTFMSPPTYVLNYVTIIGRPGDTVLLDGEEVGGYTMLADGAYQVVAVPLRSSGVHEVRSLTGRGVGIVIYGYGDYTSYMLPGGLDLRVLDIPL